MFFCFFLIPTLLQNTTYVPCSVGGFIGHILKKNISTYDTCVVSDFITHKKQKHSTVVPHRMNSTATDPVHVFLLLLLFLFVFVFLFICLLVVCLGGGGGERQ